MSSHDVVHQQTLETQIWPICLLYLHNFWNYLCHYQHHNFSVLKHPHTFQKAGLSLSAQATLCAHVFSGEHFIFSCNAFSESCGIHLKGQHLLSFYVKYISYMNQ